MDKLGRVTKRSCHICKTVSGFQCGHTFCRISYRLEYNANGSFFSIIITNCQRNPFTFFVNSHNNKFSRLASLGYSRSLNFHKEDFFCQFSGLTYFKHKFPSWKAFGSLLN